MAIDRYSRVYRPLRAGFGRIVPNEGPCGAERADSAPSAPRCVQPSRSLEARWAAICPLTGDVVTTRCLTNVGSPFGARVPVPRRAMVPFPCGSRSQQERKSRFVVLLIPQTVSFKTARTREGTENPCKPAPNVVTRGNVAEGAQIRGAAFHRLPSTATTGGRGSPLSYRNLPNPTVVACSRSATAAGGRLGAVGFGHRHRGSCTTITPAQSLARTLAHPSCPRHRRRLDTSMLDAMQTNPTHVTRTHVPFPAWLSQPLSANPHASVGTCGFPCKNKRSVGTNTNTRSHNRPSPERGKCTRKKCPFAGRLQTRPHLGVEFANVPTMLGRQSHIPAREAR